MRKLIWVMSTAVMSLSLGGCATVLNGTDTEYTTMTEPSGASVKFNNGQTCTTPCSLQFMRKRDLRADITLPGYKQTYVFIQSRLGGSTFGNIILGGGVGAIVDGSNGASNNLYPRPLIVRLAPEGSNDEAVLLSKDGKVIKAVKEHNDAVRADVAKTIGKELAGVEE